MQHKSLTTLFKVGRLLMVALFLFLLGGSLLTGLSLDPITAVVHDHFEEEQVEDEVADALEDLLGEEQAEAFTQKQRQAIVNLLEGRNIDDVIDENWYDDYAYIWPLLLLEIASILAVLALPLVFERFFATSGPNPKTAGGDSDHASDTGVRLFGARAWIWLRAAALLLVFNAICQVGLAILGVQLDHFFAFEGDLPEALAHVAYESSTAVPLLILAFGFEVMARLIHAAAALEAETALTV